MADTENETPVSGEDKTDSGSLESPDQAPSADILPGAPQPPSTTPDATPPPPSGRWRHLGDRFNVYILAFGLIILLAVGITLFAYVQSRHTTKQNHPQTASLSQSTLNQLADSDATVGSSQSILNVQSSAVFAGQVLLKEGLQVAGNLQIGGTLGLNNITVAGTGQFADLSASQNLAVSGNGAIQGTTTIGKNLQVGGSGTFNGSLSAPQITTSALDLSGNLNLTQHITTNGSNPSRSYGSALGSGGSASVSGTDTAGSISINTGSSPPAGCFITINFTTAYAGTPHVLVTPIGSAAGGLSYYVNRSSTSFSVCDSSAPPANSSFGFDYFVID